MIITNTYTQGVAYNTPYGVSTITPGYSSIAVPTGPSTSGKNVYVDLSKIPERDPQLKLKNIWVQLVQNNPSWFIKKFANKSSTWWENILKNNKLTPAQKFSQIFGVSISSLTSAAKSVSGFLGQGVGDWLSNLFSSNNLTNMEQWLRTGQNTINQIANGINLVKNEPSPSTLATQQMQLQNVISTGYNTAQDVWTTYGPWMLGGLALLLFLTLSKK
jgi:hypothetical protein